MKRVFLESEYRTLCDEYAGICLACGELADGVEPDAERYPCDVCSARRVVGLEQALMLDRITITTD